MGLPWRARGWDSALSRTQPSFSPCSGNQDPGCKPLGKNKAKRREQIRTHKGWARNRSFILLKRHKPGKSGLPKQNVEKGDPHPGSGGRGDAKLTGKRGDARGRGASHGRATTYEQA